MSVLGLLGVFFAMGRERSGNDEKGGVWWGVWELKILNESEIIFVTCKNIQFFNYFFNYVTLPFILMCQKKKSNNWTFVFV
jgi:hypothetical protein